MKYDHTKVVIILVDLRTDTFQSIHLFFFYIWGWEKVDYTILVVRPTSVRTVSVEFINAFSIRGLLRQDWCI